MFRIVRPMNSAHMPSDIVKIIFLLICASVFITFLERIIIFANILSGKEFAVITDRQLNKNRNNLTKEHMFDSL